MDKSIAETFKQKNDEIFVNKLSIDVDNNDDSLRLTIRNKISLAVLKITKKVNNMLKENGNAEYEFKNLSSIFQETGEEIEKEVNILLDKRKDALKSEIIKIDELDEGILNEVLQDIFISFKTELDIVMNTIIYVNIPDKIKDIYLFGTEEEKDSFLEKLNYFDSDISGMIETSVSERNESLKNMVLETYGKICDLNKQADEKFSK